MEEAGEVKHVRPEKDPTGRSSSEWETEKPLKRGFRPAPEPTGFLNLSGSGEYYADEDCDGK